MASVRAPEAPAHVKTAKPSHAERINAAVEAARLAGGSFSTACRGFEAYEMERIGARIGPDLIAADEPNQLHPSLDETNVTQCWHTATRAGRTRKAVLEAIDAANTAMMAVQRIDDVISGLRGGNDLGERYRELSRDLGQVINELYTMHQECDMLAKDATRWTLDAARG